MVGISPFGITFAPYIALILINKYAMISGGDIAVSEYAVAAYIFCVAGLLLQGISDGCQPLMSLSYGKKTLKVVVMLEDYHLSFH